MVVIGVVVVVVVVVVVGVVVVVVIVVAHNSRTKILAKRASYTQAGSGHVDAWKSGHRMAEVWERKQGVRACKHCFRYLIPPTCKRKTSSRVKMSNVKICGDARHV